MTGWNDLPLEIRAKIMYSGYIKHPIIDFLKEIEYISYKSIVVDETETLPSYVEHLCNIGILNYSFTYFYPSLFF